MVILFHSVSFEEKEQVFLKILEGTEAFMKMETLEVSGKVN